MLLRALIAVLLVLWLPVADGQARDAAAALIEQARTAPKRGFFWEATKGDRLVYLMATIHVGREDSLPPSADYLLRLGRANVIAVEADVFDAGKVAAIVQRLAFYGDGEPGLETRIAPALRGRIEALVRRDRLDPARLWRMKPWMLANTLAVLEAVRTGLNPAYSSEAFLASFAQVTGKPMVEIEGIEAQFRLFERASPATQIAYLQQTVDSIDSGLNGRDIKLLFTAWENRDAAAMERLLADTRDSTGVAERFVYERIIVGRNQRMAEAIERLTDSGQLHVVAVGALHFFGPDGILELLRRRGYAVTFVQ